MSAENKAIYLNKQMNDIDFNIYKKFEKIKDEKYFFKEIYQSGNKREYYYWLNKVNNFIKIDSNKKDKNSNIYDYLFDINNDILEDLNVEEYKNNHSYIENFTQLKNEKKYQINLEYINKLRKLNYKKKIIKKKILDIDFSYQKLINIFKKSSKQDN